MATTYTLISSNVLSSSAASVTFSAIPATYTDLVLRTSIRSTQEDTYSKVILRFNSDSSAIYSYTDLQGDGATPSSSRSSSDSSNTSIFWEGTSYTTNTFTSSELYIPNYGSSVNKPTSTISVTENNSSTSWIGASANLYRNTSAINSIALTHSSFAIGSSFYLYGTSNA